MTLNYPDQIVYVQKAVAVQQTIIDAMTKPTGFLGIYTFIIIASLFVWLRRVAESGEYGKFCAWVAITTVLNYATFKNTWDMPLNLQQWIPNVQGITLTYTTASVGDKPQQTDKIQGAPAIDMFFSTVTDFVNTAAVAMLNGMGNAAKSVFEGDKNCGSVEGVFRNAYLQYIKDMKAGSTVFGDGKNVDAVKVVEFTTGDLQKCAGYRTPLTIVDETWSLPDAPSVTYKGTNIKPTCEDFWKRYSSAAQACISADNDPTGALRDSLTNQFDHPKILYSMSILSKSNQTGETLDDSAYPLMVGVGSGSTIADIIRAADFALAKIGAKLQPELMKRTVSLLLVQVVCMGFLIAFSPFAIVWAFIPWHGSVINARFLGKYLAAFGFVVAWYPLLLFAKAFLYGALQ